MNVKVTELREIADTLFTYLEETDRGALEIAEDYYWSIDKEEAYDPANDPKDLTIGQLSDDWTELSAIKRGEKPPIGYALVWLSSVLKAVGEKTVH